MTFSRAEMLAKRASQAALSAATLYNQPLLNYREDAFCILLINAWELLLKAKIIKNNHNRVEMIFAREHLKRRDGSASKRTKIKTNRSQNGMTIGIVKAVETVRQYPDGIDETVRKNIEALLKVRDNASHFMNYDPELANLVSGLDQRLLSTSSNCITDGLVSILNMQSLLPCLWRFGLFQGQKQWRSRAQM